MLAVRNRTSARQTLVDAPVPTQDANLQELRHNVARKVCLRKGARLRWLQTSTGNA